MGEGRPRAKRSVNRPHPPLHSPRTRQMMRMRNRHRQRIRRVRPVSFTPGSKCPTMACTCFLSAPPVPTVAFLTMLG